MKNSKNKLTSGTIWSYKTFLRNNDEGKKINLHTTSLKTPYVAAAYDSYISKIWHRLLGRDIIIIMLLGCFSLSSRYNSEHVKRWNSKPWEDYDFTLFNNDKYIEQTWQPTYNYKNTNMPIKLNSFLLRELEKIFQIYIFYVNIPSEKCANYQQIIANGYGTK